MNWISSWMEELLGNFQRSEKDAEVYTNKQEFEDIYGEIIDRLSKDAFIMPRTLQNLHSEAPPCIAIIGQSNVGKSTLANILFGSPILATGDIPDLTDHIAQITFETGFTLFDTPGILFNPRFENVTRAFLRLPQIAGDEDDEDVMIETLPVKYFHKDEPLRHAELELGEVEKLSIDAIIWVVKLNSDPEYIVQKGIKRFSDALRERFAHKVVIAATHVDLLKSEIENGTKTHVDLENRVKRWESLTGLTVIPVSAVKFGEGLDILVEEILYKVADRVAPSSFREALTNSQRFGRLTQVIHFVSSSIAEIVDYEGSQLEAIQNITTFIYGFVSLVYSVDENVWRRHQGDAIKIAGLVSDSSAREEVYNDTVTHYRTVQRAADPFKPLEWVMSIWQSISGNTILTKEESYEVNVEKRRVVYTQIEVAGLQKIISAVYQLVFDYESISSDVPMVPLSSEEVDKIILHTSKDLYYNVQHGDHLALTQDIRVILNALFHSLK